MIWTFSEGIIKSENRSTLTDETTDWKSFRVLLKYNIKLIVQLKTKNKLIKKLNTTLKTYKKQLEAIPKNSSVIHNRLEI